MALAPPELRSGQPVAVGPIGDTAAESRRLFLWLANPWMPSASGRRTMAWRSNECAHDYRQCVPSPAATESRAFGPGLRGHLRVAVPAVAVDRPGACRTGCALRPADGSARLQPVRAGRRGQRPHHADDPDDVQGGGRTSGSTRPLLSAQLRRTRTPACTAVAPARVACCAS